MSGEFSARVRNRRSESRKRCSVRTRAVTSNRAVRHWMTLSFASSTGRLCSRTIKRA